MNKIMFVINDEPAMIAMAKKRVAVDHYDVQTETDPIKGLAKIRENPPDLILLDICMEDVSGLDICKEIKGNPKISHIPVIMVSVKAEEADVVVGLEMGAEDYIAKPFRGRELLARIK